MSKEPHRARESNDDETARRWARFAQEVSDAAVAHSIDPSHPLVQFGKYELLRVLGQGGYGMVFHGRDPKLDREVAIKFCLARDERTTRTLTREAQTLAKLKHPNIVAVYELGEHGKEVFIAMEYVAGSTVVEFVRRNPTLEAILRVFCDVGRGLAAAHDIGIVHRDVKPINILIDRDDVPRVADFGLARLYDPTATHRTRFAPSGTPAYMAPEVLRGQVPDAFSDQWSFGVSLWEVLTREELFEGRRPGQVLRQIKKQLPAKLAHERVPAAVLEVLGRALAIDPRERYPSMLALVADLARLLPAPVPEPAPGGAVIELRPISQALASKARRGAFAVPLLVALACGAIGWVGRGQFEELRVSEPSEPRPLPAPSPCALVESDATVRAESVLIVTCWRIRAGKLVDATRLWDVEFFDRKYAPNPTDEDLARLRAETIIVARTFLDQAERTYRWAWVARSIQWTAKVLRRPIPEDPIKTATDYADWWLSRIEGPGSKDPEDPDFQSIRGRIEGL